MFLKYNFEVYKYTLKVTKNKKKSGYFHTKTFSFSIISYRKNGTLRPGLVWKIINIVTFSVCIHMKLHHRLSKNNRKIIRASSTTKLIDSILGHFYIAM